VDTSRAFRQIVLIINRNNVYQLFKYTVYALLTLNVYFFFNEEWAAAAHRFVGGIALEDVIEGFAASIDTVAWVALLLMFELETYVLDGKKVTKRIAWTLYGLRAVCYTFIIYAFSGYIAKLLFLFDVTPLPNISNLCNFVTNQWAFAVTLDEYQILTTENCKSISNGTIFYQFPGMNVVTDLNGLTEIVRLAWVDVINSAVWLLVVLVLEIDIRLQKTRKFEGLILLISNTSKFILYAVLLFAAIYWGFKGKFIDFWDAFLWLVAFVFIELNVFEWHQDNP
jgi:hypothetical protein